MISPLGELPANITVSVPHGMYSIETWFNCQMKFIINFSLCTVQDCTQDMPNIDTAEQSQSNDVVQAKIEEENRIQNAIEENMGLESKFTVMVRPWVHDVLQAKKPAIYLMAQFALYKCLHKDCTFATDDDDKWSQHMEKHLGVIKFCNLIKGMTWSKEERFYNYMRYRQCPYCIDFYGQYDGEVATHMIEDHRKSNLQCSHCFYRCIEMDSIVHHYEKYHSNEPKEILLRSDQREYEYADHEKMKTYVDQNVKKIKCGQGKDD